MSAIVFAIRTWDIWSKDSSGVPSVQSPNPMRDPAIPIIQQRTVLPLTEYDTIVNRNLFYIERKPIAPPNNSGAVNPAQSVGKNIKLYGVFITDTVKTAIIDVSDQPDKRNLKRVKEGDVIQDIKIASILADRIVISQGSDQKEIRLYASNKSIRRETVEKSDKPTLILKNKESQQAPSLTNHDKKTDSQPNAQKPATDQQNVQSKEPLEEEYEIFNTPFGPIKRKKR